jgi:hypothetical protein
MTDKHDLEYRVETFYGVKKRLKELHDTYGLSWRKIASRDDFRGVSPTVLYDMVVRNIEPKKQETREILKLPIMIPTPACPLCGVVHKRNCSKTAKKRKPLMSEEEWDNRLRYLSIYLESKYERNRRNK